MPDRHVATHPVEVTDTGHLTEFLYDDGHQESVLVCAAHGGDVEPGTGEQALELAVELGASCWACFGYDATRGAFEAFHPPSSEIDPETYPLLGRIADREFETVISLHGLDGEGILVGGGIEPARKRRVRDRLDDALPLEVAVAPPGEYAGTSEANFVNWLAADGGLQLEQSGAARFEESDTVRDVLASLVAEGI